MAFDLSFITRPQSNEDGAANQIHQKNAGTTGTTGTAFIHAGLRVPELQNDVELAEQWDAVRHITDRFLLAAERFTRLRQRRSLSGELLRPILEQQVDKPGLNHRVGQARHEGGGKALGMRQRFDLQLALRLLLLVRGDRGDPLAFFQAEGADRQGTRREDLGLPRSR